MVGVVVVGSQWGDEGKGKIVDWLSIRADVVVRFQGGHNAGHTLVINGKVYKLSLLPSGVVRPNKVSIISSGVVLDLEALLKEIESVRENGVEITPENLIISDNCPLILPYHREIDQIIESAKGDNKIGTTGRGIGPAYEDKVGRRAIKVSDLFHPETLKDKLARSVFYHNALRKGLGAPPFEIDELYENLVKIKDQVLKYVKPSWLILNEYKRKGKKILFEGAQGVMLDVEHGTYPYVTSSNTVAAQASIGSGLGVQAINNVLGITKAYTTRVGSGPFPTELFDEIGELIGSRGKEFGTVTGRKRRCGWFDSVMVRQAIKISGITGIALTKLDVLDGFEKIKICVGYKYQNQELDYLPSSSDIQGKIEPVYEEIEGWSASTVGARTFKDLPAKAIKYVRRIEELIQTPVAILSTSPERDDTIMVKDPFAV